MAHGLSWGNGNWGKEIQAYFADADILNELLSEAGMVASGPWKWDTELALVGQAVVDFAREIGRIPGMGVSAGLERLQTLTGSVELHRQSSGPIHCAAMAACTFGNIVQFYDSLFTSSDSYIRGTAVHELGHAINNANCNPNGNMFCGGVGFGIPDQTHYITKYGDTNGFEYWAEVVAVWVYGNYKNDSTYQAITNLQASYVEGVFQP